MQHRGCINKLSRQNMDGCGWRVCTRVLGVAQGGLGVQVGTWGASGSFKSQAVHSLGNWDTWEGAEAGA